MTAEETAVPESLEGSYICVNGELYPPDQPHLRAYDRGFLYADGVFDSFPVVDSKGILADRHIDRLFRSASAAQIDLPHSKDTIKEWAVETLEESSVQHGACRIVVSRGASKQGLSNTHLATDPTVVILPHHEPAKDTDYGQPSEEVARIVSTRTIPPDSVDPKLKGLDYLINVLAERELVGTDASIGIMLDHQGRVAEGYHTNVFLRDEQGRIRTPDIVSALAGVTRAVFIEQAEKRGYDVVEGDVTPTELYTAQDVFVTSSGKGVAAIVELNGRAIGGEELSEDVREIATAFREYILNNEYVPIET